MTMMDPTYQQKLEAVQEMTPTAPRVAVGPKGPSISQTPKGPAVAQGPKTPGLGGQTAQQHAAQQQDDR
mgnify:CR=1 FL=1